MDLQPHDFEEFLKEKILSKLEKGRPNFDKPHTIAVVYWLKKIIQHNPKLNLDANVLLISAYTHDWGYVNMFKQGQQLQYRDVENIKTKHMKLGAKKLDELLNNRIFSFLSDKQKKRAIHLVAVHDSLVDLKDPDELVLMEADTLGGLDTNFVVPTFNFESNNKYMQHLKEKRIPKFITEFSKKNSKILIQKRINYYTTKQENKKNKILPDSCFIILLVFVFLFHFILPIQRVIPHPYNYFGLVIIAIGIVITFFVNSLLLKNSTSIKPYEYPSILITSGLFKFSRNPLYLGMTIVLFGVNIFLGSISPFIFLILFIICIDRIFIPMEEKNLEKKFGEKYRNYKNAVRRWI